MIYGRWKDRDNLYIKEIRGLDYVQEQKQIYYDTDGITENQVRNFKVCNKCSGLDTINSSSNTRYHVFAITIPRDACSDCIDEGYKLYKNTSNKFTNVYLQDKINDDFFAK